MVIGKVYLITQKRGSCIDLLIHGTPANFSLKFIRYVHQSVTYYKEICRKVTIFGSQASRLLEQSRGKLLNAAASFCFGRDFPGLPVGGRKRQLGLKKTAIAQKSLWQSVDYNFWHQPDIQRSVRPPSASKSY